MFCRFLFLFFLFFIKLIVFYYVYFLIVDVLDMVWSLDDSFFVLGSVDNIIIIWNV